MTNFEGYLDSILPKIELLSIDNIPIDATFIAIAGFEDRGFSFLDKIINKNIKFINTIGLEYRPFNEKNRIAELLDKLPKITAEKVDWIIYNRYDPFEFINEFKKRRELLEVHNVIIDISGMSKYLIMLILDLLEDYPGNVHIIYSEARIYHPTQDEFNRQKAMSPEKKIPTFLTKEVNNIVTLPFFSSGEMQGYPRIIIAFPSFNHSELEVLLNEMNPQYLIKIEGIPHEDIDKWRLEAIHWLNEHIDSGSFLNIREVIQETVTTFDYKHLIIYLDKIFKKYRHYYKLIIAPTGSKLQTFGVFIFKQMHPEITIVYPATKEHANDYSEGVRNTWHISIPKFSNFLNTLNKHRRFNVLELKDKISSSPNYQHLLHISDIHLKDSDEATKYQSSLMTDLIKNLHVKKLDFLAISGDIANLSKPDEYKAATKLLQSIIEGFNLDPKCVIIVPGNHDVNWDFSEKSYTKQVLKSKLSKNELAEKYIPYKDDDNVVLERDEKKYLHRFKNFNKFFYKTVFGEEYPLEYKNQSIIYEIEEWNILFLGLNSSWEIDHYKEHRARSSINMVALSNALIRLLNNKYDNWLKIVVFHHPASGPEMMKDTGFLQRLAEHNFQICMSGHIHEPSQDLYKHNIEHDIHFIGAGVFGSPSKDHKYAPLHYNLLKLDLKNNKVIVETRKKNTPDGSWIADARWGDINANPEWKYSFDLKRKGK